MRKRGMSLAEVLICLALISVMLAMVALLCRDLGRDRASRAKVDAQSQLDLGLLHLAQEWKSIIRVTTPLPAATSSTLVVVRPDPALESDPPQAGDRLPYPLPTPALASWDSDDPAQQTKLRYEVDPQLGLVRRTLPAGIKIVRLAGARDMTCHWLADGRLQAEFELVLEQRPIQRRLTLLVPVS